MFGVEHRELRIYARGGICVQAHFFQTLGNRLRDQGRRQIGVRAQQCVADGVGCGPFAAAVAVHLIELTQHARAFGIRPVVELFFQLVFDELALFFNHHDFLQPLRERLRALGLEWPDHAHFVHTDAQAFASLVVQPQIQQSLSGVVVGLAAGHQAKAVVGATDHRVVQTVGADVGQRGIPFVIEQTCFLRQSVVGPTDVHATCRHVKFGGHDLQALGIDVHRGAGLHNFLDGFHA